ncbi:MAG TPA: HIT domain-containing protein [Desulfuromonadales bacterium]|nr:HIT domain-containing protein [Desulfuromonadales bacterium]
MNDANYPWFILVPQREGVQEIHELSAEDQNLLVRESSALSASVSALFEADKMNIAALGNIVSQLHLHHVVRYRTDIAWPAPVWGFRPAAAYSRERIDEIRRILPPCLPDFTALPAGY